MKNGEASITHCLGCGAQFEEPQKVGDFIPCDDCGDNLRLTVKTKSE